MIHRYSSHAHYCRTPVYQQWRAQWRPPQHVVIDRWHDTESEMHDQNGANPVTPRAHARQRHATRLAHHLLDSLEIRDRCVDIGCGDNWFHHGHDARIWGVDPHNEAHRDELLTPGWFRSNWGQWPHAFSVNAMHFCEQSAVPDQVAKVRGVLRPGGTAVMTLNRARIADSTPDYDAERLFGALSRTPGMTRMVWMDDPADAPMDGNVWLWLRR